MKPSLLVTLAAAAACLPTDAGCVGDLDLDGVVGGSDLAALLSEWGTDGGSTGADMDGSGTVGGGDVAALLGAWGACPPTVPAWATLVEAAPDPGVVTDPSLRAAIAATGLAWRVRDTATQVEMLLVPPGTFQMGCISPPVSATCFVPEYPVHDVTLTRACYLGRFEVTQAQWVARMGSNPSFFAGWPDAARLPVERVTFDAVQGFLAATGMRLPTEAEWERACRAGTQAPYHDGSTSAATMGAIAWHGGNSGGSTHVVGTKAANALGFHDMLGNVWEWVGDWYGWYPSTPEVDPTGPPSATHRVIRGASWINGAAFARSSMRNGELPTGTGNGQGFRVARDP